MQIGPAEIAVILFIALLVFGPQRLPEVGRQVGAAVRELRRMQDTVKGELDSVLHPDLSPSFHEDAEPGDHTAIATNGTPEISGPDDDVTSASSDDAGDGDEADPRFAGPPESFI
jgi:sec-independent protein translocase protein TatB